MNSGCQKDEIQTDNNCLKGKFVQYWCGNNLGVIQVTSGENIGTPWRSTLSAVKYNNIVLAKLDSNLLKNMQDWKGVINSKDSTFYFTYDPTSKEPVSTCYICCPPDKTIIISSLSINPCTPKTK